MASYIGSIKIFASNFELKGWMYCNGQLLEIMKYSTLFAVIGANYGGDGMNTFALPDLRGRVPVGKGQGSGLSPIHISQKGGSENISITVEHMPAHNHLVTGTIELPVNDVQADLKSPVDAYLARSAAGSFLGTPGTDFAGNMNVSLYIALAGGGRSIESRSPYLGLNYLICVGGIFPSRN